jgi:drug/metabolite transporter (DMT)-like permease
MLVSESLAVGAAFCLALGGMITAELKGRVSIVRLALWQTFTAAILTSILATIIGGWSTIRASHIPNIWASGLFGTVLANVSFVAAIFILGPRPAVLLFSLNAPFALLLGFLVLGEAVRPLQALGVLLVIVGIALAVLFGAVPSSRPRVEGSATGPSLRLGLGIGVLSGVASALFQAVANLVARPVMSDGVDAIAAMSLRATFAAACFLIVSLLPLSMLRDRQAFSLHLFAISAAGAVIATGLGMSLLMAALASGRGRNRIDLVFACTNPRPTNGVAEDRKCPVCQSMAWGPSCGSWDCLHCAVLTIRSGQYRPSPCASSYPSSSSVG